MSRTIVIGDIHGCSKELGLLLDKVSPRIEDVIISLGDVTDKGPDCVGVIRMSNNSMARLWMIRTAWMMVTGRKAPVARVPPLEGSINTLVNALPLSSTSSAISGMVRFASVIVWYSFLLVLVG